MTGVVDNFSLYEAGLVATPFHTIKVIARGELSSKLTLKVQGASKSVVTAIEKAGGKFERVPTPLQKSAKEAEEADK
jgi:ribosomal protein L18e/L15